MWPFRKKQAPPAPVPVVHYEWTITSVGLDLLTKYEHKLSDVLLAGALKQAKSCGTTDITEDHVAIGCSRLLSAAQKELEGVDNNVPT